MSPVATTPADPPGPAAPAGGWPLSFLTLPVADVARAAAFYRALGLPPADRSPPGCAFFALPGATLALLSADHFARETGAPAPPPGGAGQSWNTAQDSDIESILALCCAAGGTVLRPPSPTPWGGRRAWMADPDGHRWEVVWNPRRLGPPWQAGG